MTNENSMHNLIELTGWPIVGCPIRLRWVEIQRHTPSPIVMVLVQDTVST